MVEGFASRAAEELFFLIFLDRPFQGEIQL